MKMRQGIYHWKKPHQFLQDCIKYMEAQLYMLIATKRQLKKLDILQNKDVLQQIWCAFQDACQKLIGKKDKNELNYINYINVF